MSAKVSLIGSGAATVALLCCTLMVQAQGATSVRDGVYTEEQAKRGEAQYLQSCGPCHGASLGGGEMAPSVAGPDFISNWNGLTVGDLLDRIRTTMPQDAPGSLSPQQNADVLAYMLSVSKFPAGQTELARQPDMLKAIKIEPPQ